MIKDVFNEQQYAFTDDTFVGKTAAFYGDSLTEQNFQYSKGYHKWVQEICGFASYTNRGHGGDTTQDCYNKINSNTETADVIFCMIGTNDPVQPNASKAVPLGTPADTTLGTTYGNLYKICELLQTKYPNKLKIMITPHYQTNYPFNAPGDEYGAYETSQAILTQARKFAIPVYDNFQLSGIYPTNLADRTNDNCHWNDATHEMVGKNLSSWVISHFRYLYKEAST